MKLSLSTTGDTAPRSRRLKDESLGRLLLRLSIPGVVGMFIQSTYNLVDTIFVGRIGDTSTGVKAITALAAVLPVQLLIIALAVGTGVGVASMISRLLGQDRKGMATAVANNAIFICIIYALVTAVVGFFFSGTIMRLFVSDRVTIAMGSEYLGIIMLFSFSIYFFIIGERILQAQGNTFTPMLLIGGTALLNIVLDPILIFGIGPVPSMGVKGAAIATVLARSLGAIAMVIMLVSGRNELRLNLKKHLPRKSVLKGIYNVGAPSFLMQFLGSASLWLINYLVRNISPYYIAVLGLFFRTQSFFLMPIMGIGHALLPIIAYNHGLGDHGRVRKTLVLGLKLATAISATGFILFMVFPGFIISIFNADATLISVGEKAFRRMAILYFLTGSIVVITIFFQAVGKGKHALWIIVVQRVLVLLPLIYALRIFVTPINLWLAFPISTVWALSVASILVFRHFRNQKKGSAKGVLER